MRILTAILMLAAAMPSFAQTENYSIQSEVRVIDQTESGNPDLVKEYDGRRHDGVETDMQFSKVGDKNYIEMGAYGLGGPAANGYFNLNLGSALTVKGQVSNLTHRLPFTKTPISINGQYVNSTSSNTIDVFISSWTVAKQQDLTGAIPMYMDRTENELNLVLPYNKESDLTAGFWQENEIGVMPARYNGSSTEWNANSGANGTVPGLKAARAEINRLTRDLSAGLNTAMGNGNLSLDVTHRVYEELATLVVSSITIKAKGFTPVQVVKPLTPGHKMDLYDIRFRGNADAKVAITGALSARTRTSTHNDYTGSAYYASLSGAYQPAKKIHLTAKVSNRMATVSENRSFVTDYFTNTSGVSQSKAWGVTGGGEDAIDRNNLAGELQGRYEYSDHLSFRAGYKYENNYRRHADVYVEQFTSSATYQDGTFVPENTHHQRIAVQDTKHIMSAGVEAMLPFDAELEVGLSKMVANRAVFEIMPTVQDKVEASVSVPLPLKLTLLASGEYVAEKNKKAELTDPSMYLNAYHTALEWAGTSKVSAGADYSYEQASYRGTAWFGQQDWPANATQLINQIHLPGYLYRYENNVIGLHATLMMPKGFSLTGRGSYTMSRQGVPVDFTGLLRDGRALSVTNLAPSHVRIASGSLALKYAQSKDLTARLGYRRDQYIDKVLSENSGYASYVDASVSAKF